MAKKSDFIPYEVLAEEVGMSGDAENITYEWVEGGLRVEWEE